jgi:DNA glycosylase AlkZ-like
LYVVPPVSHLELTARVPGFRSEDLVSLMESRSLIGLRCLRGSAFLMPADLLRIVVPATRERNVKAFAGYLRKHLLTADYETWTRRVEDVLGPGERLTKAEITERLDPPEADRAFMTNVVSQMATESRLIGVRVPVSWRSAQITYTRWQDWLPDVDVMTPDPYEARVELARLYLRAFGPASVEDFAWWSGLTKTQAGSVIADSGATADGDVYQFEPVGTAIPLGVRLLPIWDTLFVTWRDRSRLVPEALLPYIYDPMGNATSVILIDGVVGGVWSMGPDDDPLQVTAAPFSRFTKKQWDAIEAEAQVLANLAGAENVSLIRADDPPNLRLGKRNLFMRPV